jgi:hypothetical protein
MTSFCLKDTLSENDVDFLTQNTSMKDREAIQLQFKSFLQRHPRGCITKKDFRFLQSLTILVIKMIIGDPFITKRLFGYMFLRLS